MKKETDVLGIILVIGVVVAIVAALTLITMLLWNWIMPGIILCNTINFWQAAGLLVVISLLTMDKSKLFEWLYE